MDSADLCCFVDHLKLCFENLIGPPGSCHPHQICRLFSDIELGESLVVYEEQSFAANKVTAQSKSELVAQVNKECQGLFYGIQQDPHNAQ